MNLELRKLLLTASGITEGHHVSVKTNEIGTLCANVQGQSLLGITMHSKNTELCLCKHKTIRSKCFLV